MDMLVSTNWLRKHLDAPDTVVIDCTNFADWSQTLQRYQTVSGVAHWREGHIKGARHADFTQAGFTNDRSAFRNALPDPESFASAMAKLGVSAKARVVLYDDAGSQWAARVWWMLRWIGFDRAAVLDGGWTAWCSDTGQVSLSDAVSNAGSVETQIRPEMFVDLTQLQAALAKGTALIDGLSADQFYGRSAQLGLKGHIPGAINIPSSDLIDPETLAFLPLEKLSALFPSNRNVRQIVYCGSGIAAASVAFTMVRLGFSDVAIYMPGLQEWSADNSVTTADA